MKSMTIGQLPRLATQLVNPPVASSLASMDPLHDLATSNDPRPTANESRRQDGINLSPPQPDPATAEFRKYVARMQLTKARQHIHFLNECDQEGLIPKGLCLHLAANVMQPTEEIVSSIDEILSMASREILGVIKSHCSTLCTHLEREAGSNYPLTNVTLTAKYTNYTNRLAARRNKKLEALCNPNPRVIPSN